MHYYDNILGLIGRTSKDEWPCQGPDAKGRARPGPNILIYKISHAKAQRRKGGKA